MNSLHSLRTEWRSEWHAAEQDFDLHIAISWITTLDLG
jgi:hypothetical protein